MRDVLCPGLGDGSWSAAPGELAVSPAVPEEMLMPPCSSQTSFSTALRWCTLKTSFPAEEPSYGRNWETGGGTGPGVMFC